MRVIVMLPVTSLAKCSQRHPASTSPGALTTLTTTRSPVPRATAPSRSTPARLGCPASLPMVPQCPLEQVPDGRQSDGMLRLCCVGRVHPIKNVHIALQALRQLTVPVVLRVLGPAEDAVYLEECQRIVASLPTVVRVEFCGVQSEAEVRRSLIESDAMILPTQGENFGHAIFESLAVGTPVVISDCTIWRDLVRQEAGWDLPLTAPEAFGQVLAQLAVMSGDERQRLRRGALRLAQGFVASHRFREDYLKLFFDQA